MKCRCCVFQPKHQNIPHAEAEMLSAQTLVTSSKLRAAKASEGECASVAEGLWSGCL